MFSQGNKVIGGRMNSSSLKKMFKVGRRLALRILAKFIFLKRNVIVFSSVPDFSDNAKAFYDYLVQQKVHFELIWLVRESSVVKELQDRGIEAFYFFSFTGIFTLLTAKYVITTHIVSPFKSPGQKVINLWHGMPLKSMGFIDPNESKKDLMALQIQSKNTDMMIATSQVMKNALASCFFIDPRKIFITGQPRNDNVFNKDLSEDLKSIIPLKRITENRKILLYSPTFRQREDLNRIEGNTLTADIFRLGQTNYYGDLEKFLEENDLFLIFKLHPFEEKLFLKENTKKLPKHVFLLTNRKLFDNNIIVNDLLSYIDILITDYSSIYFDFLLLNRPIIFLVPDLDKYRTIRTFALEPYNFWMPGRIVKTYDELKGSIVNYLEDPSINSEKRQLINTIVNNYTDNNASKRIFDIMKSIN